MCSLFTFLMFHIIRYWKKLACEYKSAADEAKAELEEFQEDSRALEHELESQLEQAEAKTKELKSLSNKYDHGDKGHFIRLILFTDCSWRMTTSGISLNSAPESIIIRSQSSRLSWLRSRESKRSSTSTCGSWSSRMTTWSGPRGAPWPAWRTSRAG